MPHTATKNKLEYAMRKCKVCKGKLQRKKIPHEEYENAPHVVCWCAQPGCPLYTVLLGTDEAVEALVRES